MPLHTADVDVKLPTFKQWKASQTVTGEALSKTFQVFGVYLPNKYPDITFVTEEFRYSFRCPDGLDTELGILINEGNEAIVLDYDGNAGTITIYGSVEFATINPKFKLTTGEWLTTHAGYVWNASTLPKKPRKGKATMPA